MSLAGRTITFEVDGVTYTGIVTKEDILVQGVDVGNGNLVAGMRSQTITVEVTGRG